MVADYTFGVEIEFSSPMPLDALAAQMRTASGQPVQADGYHHSVRTFWRLTTDGSLHPTSGHRYTGELVSPILTGEDGLEKLKAVVQALSDAGARINRSCGMHVHIGRVDRNWTLAQVKNFAKFYAKHEHIIDAIMPESRKASNNTFCRSTLSSVSYDGRFVEMDDANETRRTTAVNRLMDKIEQASDVRSIGSVVQGGQRYCKLNFHPFTDRGTIEVRHHSSTVNATKAVNWVRFLLAMMDKSNEITFFHKAKPVMRSLESQFGEFARKFLPEDLGTYYKERFRTLIGDGDEVTGRRTRRRNGGAAMAAPTAFAVLED